MFAAPVDIVDYFATFKGVFKALNKCRQLRKESNRKAMNRNWSNQKANPALKTKTGNK